MGGAESEVREDTTAILLEAAYFDGQTVRKASRDLGLRSEASARYEKALIRPAFCWRLNGPAVSFRRMPAEKCSQARLKKTI